MPPYELRSEDASWSVLIDGEVTTAEDKRAKAVAAVESLVGNTVSDSSMFIPAFELEIEFSNGTAFLLTPFKSAFAEDEELWSMRGPDSIYALIKASCRTYLQQAMK